MCGARTKTSGAARKWGEKAGGAPRRMLCPQHACAAASPPRPHQPQPSSHIVSSAIKQPCWVGVLPPGKAQRPGGPHPTAGYGRLQRCGLLFSGALPYLAAPAGAEPAQLCAWLAASAPAGPTAVPPATPLPWDPCSCMVHTGCCSTTLAYPEQQPCTRFQAVQQHLAVRDFWLHMHGLWVSTSPAAHAS